MRIAVLVSGGVDSSLALALLRQAGHDLTAFYLKIWLEDDTAFLGECPWEEDLQYVRQVCDQLSVPLEILPLQREYHARVVSYTIEELKAGRTPSPDLFCNQRIKFGVFLARVEKDYQRVASGHYARIGRTGDSVRLLTAPDPVKDQTYFLAHLSAAQLAHLEFPVGGYLKSEVRDMAARFELPTATRRDSQGICFLGKIRYRDFARAYLGERAGEIIDINSGETLGEHRGFWFYTIGQRSGLGLHSGPWYVVDKDVSRNIVYVSHSREGLERARDSYRIDECNWINQPPAPEDELWCKLRHGPQHYGCTLTPEGSGYRVRLDRPDQGIAPGQFTVVYRGEECLGCGKIAEK